MSRTQVIRAVCEYVKQNNLQDPADRRSILCDGALRSLFDGEPRVTYFSLNRHLSPHMEKIKRVYKKRPRPGAAAAGQDAEAGEEGARGGLNAPMRLAPALRGSFLAHTNFLPAGEAIEYLSRPTVVRLLWSYAREQGLQDERDGRIVRLHASPMLQRLLGIDASSLPPVGAPPGTDPLCVNIPRLNGAVARLLHKLDRTGARAEELSRAEALARDFERRLKHIGGDRRSAGANATPRASPAPGAGTDVPAGAAAASSPTGELDSSDTPRAKKLRPNPDADAPDDGDEEQDEEEPLPAAALDAEEEAEGEADMEQDGEGEMA